MRAEEGDDRVHALRDFVFRERLISFEKTLKVPIAIVESEAIKKLETKRLCQIVRRSRERHMVGDEQEPPAVFDPNIYR